MIFSGVVGIGLEDVAEDPAIDGGFVVRGSLRVIGGTDSGLMFLKICAPRWSRLGSASDES